MISILDFGMGNVGSVSNAFKRLDADVCVVDTASQLLAAEKIVLPGVGSFDAAMKNLNSVDGLVEALNKKVLEQCVPVLGICLGMQILFTGSAEGICNGLNWIPGYVYRFPDAPNFKVPHIGWRSVYLQSFNELSSGIECDDKFYFVHSYYAKCDDEKYSFMKCEYGDPFTAAVKRQNIFGVQFHPEKSHDKGLTLLKNFKNI